MLALWVIQSRKEPPDKVVIDASQLLVIDLRGSLRPGSLFFVPPEVLRKPGLNMFCTT